MKPFNPLKKKRLELCLTKEDISNKINIKLSTIKHYETGERNPTVKDIIYLCRVGYQMSNEEIIEYLEYLDKIRKE